MTKRDRRVATLVAVLLGLGPSLGLAQVRPVPPVDTAPQGRRPFEGGAVLQQERPTLSWQPPREATSVSVRYRVRVLPVEGPSRLGRPVWEQEGLTAPSVIYGGPPLDPRRAYVWTMEAVDAKGRVIAADGGIFARTAGFLFPDFCIPLVFPSANKICKGGTVTVWAALFSSQGGTTTYVLSDGLNPPTSGVWPGSVTLSPAATTAYSLTLKRGSCQASSQFTIAVADPPALGPAACSPAATQSDPFIGSQSVDVCCGSGLQCKADNPVAGNVQWTADGLPIPGGTGAGINVNPSALACDPNVDKTVVLQATAATDPVCQAVQSNPVQVTLHRPSELGGVTVSNPVICADGVSKSKIGLSPPVVGTVTWQRQPGCAGPWQAFTPPQLPFEVGPLQQPDCYKVTVQNAPCAKVEQTVKVDVDLKPAAGTITATPDPICPGNDSVLILNGSSGNVQWYSSTDCIPAAVFASPMGGATGNTVQNTNILQQTTCYGVEVSSLKGVCPSVKGPLKKVTVQSLPAAPVVTGPQILCPGKTVTLSSSAAGQWFHDGDPVGPPPFNEPGNYWVTATNACGSADSNILTVKPDLMTVQIKGPCCDCSGGKVQLCATASQQVGATSFVWSHGAVGPCTQVQPQATTTYTVTATDAAGCAVSTSFTVTVCP